MRGTRGRRPRCHRERALLARATKFYYAYMMTNDRRTVLYTGITGDLNVRVWQHKNKAFGGFTKKYNCDRPVWFAEFTEVIDAIAAEKRIKGRTRVKKNALVNEMNPEWKDLAADWYTETY